MRKLDNQELTEVIGGAVTWGLVGIVISGLVAFAIGVLEGFKRPTGCTK